MTSGLQGVASNQLQRMTLRAAAANPGVQHTIELVS
jgi:hypothetical protein